MLTLIILSTVLSSVYAYDEHCNKGTSENTTCKYQLPDQNLSNEDCFIDNFKRDDADCRDLTFRYKDGSDLGQVRLEAVHLIYRDIYKSTKLNATFSKINWNFLQMQYKRRSDQNICTRRAFHLSPEINLSLSTSLFYDCLFSNQSYEGLEYDFKYEARNTILDQYEGRHYIFRVPNSRNIEPNKTPLEEWEVFMYIDISSLPELILRWQQVPDYFGVKSYRVDIFYGKDGSSDEKFASEEISADDELSYSVKIGSSGRYYFTIQIVHDSCSHCSVVKSPLIIIDNASWTPLVIGIVGCVILLPVFMYAFYIWKRYGLLKSAQTPVVLILYKRTRNTHIKAVVALANYLRDVCHIESLLDEIHIPLSECKDPFIWYQDAFACADSVMVVTSPPQISTTDGGIYRNVDTVALRLLAGKFSDFKCQQKFLSVVVPYCKENNIPVEAKNLPRFCLMNDLNEMLWYIHHGTRSSIVSKLEYLLFQSHLTGGKSDFKRHGQILADAFTEAEIDTKKIGPDESNDLKKPHNEIDILQQFDSVALLPKSENKFNISFYPPKPDPNADDIFGVYPGNINNLNLDGTEEESLNSQDKTKSPSNTEFDINDLPL